MTQAAKTKRRETKIARDDAFRSAWPSLRTPSRRLFAAAIVLAVLAHLPALPIDPVFLAHLLFHTPAPAEPPPAASEVLVPVDLDLLGEEPRTQDSPAPSAPPPADAPPTAGTAEKPTGDAPTDPTPVANPTPKTSPVVSTPKPAEDIYEDLEKPKQGTASTKDALTVAGGPGKFGPKSPNVQVLFNGSRLRGNTAGAALGGVLTALPEWKSFFEGTEIDPIADSEYLLIAGPQFRRSGEVVVWMQYRGSEADIRKAMDTLVKRTKGGKWLDDAPVPAALAKAHGHMRVFALIPNKKLLAIMPAAAQKDLAKLKNVTAFNKSSKAGIVISLATPRNAFSGYENVIDIPKSIKWMRLVVTPLKEGGADLTLEMADESAAKAAQNAPGIEKQLSQIRTLAKLATLIGSDVLPPMKVEVDNDLLRVNATVPQKGLNLILALAKGHFAKDPEPDPKDNPPSKEGGKDSPKGSDKATAAPSASSTASPSAPTK
ncbi:MAG: hypothetical protein IPK82_31330 [Polyangiaceae bacterium]|nr:hypothetical protein [Polyangiaceae bacterium]